MVQSSNLMKDIFVIFHLFLIEISSFWGYFEPRNNIPRPFPHHLHPKSIESKMRGERPRIQAFKCCSLSFDYSHDQVSMDRRSFY